MDLDAIRAAHAAIDVGATNGHTDTTAHNLPTITYNPEVNRELLRNWDIVSVEKVGRLWQYKLSTGQMFESFYDPSVIEYQHGN